MKEARSRILEALQNKAPFTEALEREVLRVLRKRLDPDQFIQKVNEESKWEDCLRCNGQPFCSLFLAVAYLEKGAVIKARSEVEQAIIGYRVRGLRWNEALGYWMLGTILLEAGDSASAERSLQKSLEILRPLLREYRSASNNRQARQCVEHIQEIENTIKDIDRRSGKKTTDKNHSSAEHNAGPIDTKTATVEITTGLVIPWIPIYKHTEVEEGVGEPAWIEHSPNQRAQMTEISIDGMGYTIHPVRRSTRQVALTPDQQYGWVKVHGQGMSTARPTSLQEGDYVLFHESDWPEQNEIVIVSRVSVFAVEGQFSYMIRRYSEPNHELLSETSVGSDKYQPINITEDYRCLGVVLAVAKPKI